MRRFRQQCPPSLTGMPSATSRAGRTSFNASMASTVLYCRSRLVTSSTAASQCRLMSFSGSSARTRAKDCNSSPSENSSGVSPSSSQGSSAPWAFHPAARRAYPARDGRRSGLHSSLALRDNVQRPISPRVHPFSARDLNAAVTWSDSRRGPTQAREPLAVGRPV